jgi:hypothetical protein
MARQVKRQTENWTYVLEADRALPEAEQTKFTLKPLNPNERDRIIDGFSSTVTLRDGTKEVHDHGRELSGRLPITHVVAIDNFPVGAPKPWPEDRDERIAYLAQMDDRDVRELGTEIWNKSVPIPVDVKPFADLAL